VKEIERFEFMLDNRVYQISCVFNPYLKQPVGSAVIYVKNPDGTERVIITTLNEVIKELKKYLKT
jgi:hypothetical protein